MSLRLDRIKENSKLVGKCNINPPNAIYYRDSDKYEYGNLLFCDLFSIIWHQKHSGGIREKTFLESSADCKYMTVKHGEWNLYENETIETYGHGYKYKSNNLIMINSVIDNIDGFIFNESFDNSACHGACTVQILDVSQVWFTSEMMYKWNEINEANIGLGFFETYPLINTGGDTGITMKCYKYNNEIYSICIGLAERGEIKEMINNEKMEKVKEEDWVKEYISDIKLDDQINLIIIDNNKEYNRVISTELSTFIPAIREMISSIASNELKEIPIKLPEFTDIDDFDEFIETLIYSIFIDSTGLAFRLMGPAMIATFLGISFNLEVYIEEVFIDINSNFKTVSEKLSEKCDINADIKYEYPYIKFSFPNERYGNIEELDNAIELIQYTCCNREMNSLTLESVLVYPVENTGNNESLDKRHIELWIYTGSKYLNYIPNYVSTTHKTMINNPKYPSGKLNDYKILRTITKDHSLYHISRGFVETLIKEQWRWQYFDSKIFKQITKVIAHFKEINNFIWD